MDRIRMKFAFFLLFFINTCSIVISIGDDVNGTRSFGLVKSWIRTVNDFSETSITGCYKINNDDVVYYLYTNSSFSMQVLNAKESSSFEKSTFDFKRHTKILVHGWMNEGIYFWKDTIEAYFNGSVLHNVIVVDWHRYSPPCMNLNRVIEEVGTLLADMLSFLIDNGVKPNRFHIIGYSLGTQISGFAAHSLSSKYKLSRITGLDPVGFGFYQKSLDPILSDKSADFVDCIHTSLGTTTSVRLGHADFYPNGGLYQPNCSLIDISCSHAMSAVYFTYSIRHPKAYCSTKCDSYLSYQNKMCENMKDIEYMGEYVSTKARGQYFLDTKGELPLSC